MQNIYIIALTNGGNGGHNLPQLKLVQNGGLTSGIKTNHKDAHLFLGEKPAEKLGECQPHVLSSWIPTGEHNTLGISAKTIIEILQYHSDSHLEINKEQYFTNVPRSGDLRF